MEPKIVGKRIEKLITNSQMTIEEVAKKIGIKNKELHKKLEGKEEFYISEIIALTKLLNLDIEECEKIFFHKDEATSK